MNKSIYVAYHKLDPVVKTETLKPIHVGKARTEVDLGFSGDDTGDNISLKNENFCELTALYWMWKNDDISRDVGLMHYRRVFDFAGEHDDHYQTEYFAERNKLFDLNVYNVQVEKFLETEYKNYDIVASKPHRMPMTVKENYDNEHYISDLELVGEIIAEKYPEYSDYFEAYINEHVLYMFNMFVTSKEIFNEYCEWLFDILFEAEKKIQPEVKLRNTYNARVYGFLSERLFGTYLTKIMKEGKYKIKFLNVINLAEANIVPKESIKTIGNEKSEKDINIVFSSDDNYVPHTAAFLRSILENKNSEYTYNFYFFSTHVQEKNIKILNNIVKEYENCTFKNISIGDYFSTGFRANNSLPSSATYNRFLIFEILKNLDRVLYIDVDTIVQSDLVELYFSDLQGKAIGACRDLIMSRCINVKVVLPNGYGDMYEYMQKELGLNQTTMIDYFNAGVIVFDLKHMDCKKVYDDLMALFTEKEFFFQDQDILNLYFRDNKVMLDIKYNIFNSEPYEFSDVPVMLNNTYKQGVKNPHIIHYAASHNKPWRNIDCLFSYEYFKYLRDTPYYEHIIINLSRIEFMSFSKSDQTRMEMSQHVKNEFKNSIKVKFKKPYKVYSRLRYGRIEGINC